MTSELEEIRAEAVKIIGITLRLRAAERENAEREGKLQRRFVTFQEMASGEVLPHGEPKPTDSPSEIFDETIRFWALRVAARVTFPEWEAMVSYAKAQKTGSGIDVIRFFENRFEGLHLADGEVIMP